MAPADGVEATAKASPLFGKYGTRVDNESARELLAKRVAPEEEDAEPGKAPKAEAPRKKSGDGLGGFLKSREGKALVNTVVRGVFGLLKKRR